MHQGTSKLWWEKCINENVNFISFLILAEGQVLNGIICNLNYGFSYKRPRGSNG